jgi:hypothetical protein
VAKNHFGSFNGYANRVGGGIMNPAGGGFNNPAMLEVPNDSTSAEGAPLVDVVGGPNLSVQNRPSTLPDGSAVAQLYNSIGFRAQPDPPAPQDPQNETTAFYAGAWVRNLSDAHAGLESFDDLNQVILGRRPFVGNGSGEGIDNIPGDDHWHLFMRDDDAAYGGSGKLTWQMGDGTNLINFESDADLYDSAWHFVMFSYNGDPTDPDALSLYVDGMPVDTTRSVTGSAANLFIVSGGADWLVTVGNSGGKNNIWDGPIDETFLGWGELSAAQVLELWELATISTQVPGDADGDGDVDADDMSVISLNYGQATANGAADGDHNGDGVVDLDDWDIASSNYGVGPGEGASSLPEPASALALLAAAPFMFTRRPRRGR